MKLTVWMAQNKNGEFLCYDNKNLGLSYHLSFPYDCGYLSHERWVMCRTKWEVGLHVKRWRIELDTDTAKRGLGSLANNARCRPVKMIVSWEPATKGENK